MGGASSTASCCYRREAEFVQPRTERCESWHSIPDADEHWLVFEEAEQCNGEDQEKSGASGGGAPHPQLLKRSSWTKLRGRPLQLVPEEVLAETKSAGFVAPSASQRALSDEDRRNLHLVPRVGEAVTNEWTERRAHPETLSDKLRKPLENGFPELEQWTSQEHCLRMLRALQGNEAAATKQLIKAIECRVRDRELYATLTCDVHCDIRVIGRDLQQRPTIYICARSQKVPLRDISPQVQLAFEAAVRLGEYQGDGQIVMVADMHGFAPSLYMDVYAIQELGETLGSVFADRFASILMVDFSIIAQGIWSLAKPLMSAKTQSKINFVGVKAAREIVQARFPESTGARILASFDINRDKRTSDEERAAHALHTSICDVPLGHVRSADVAG
mmetsp:Transcript_109728/g.317277  ORF Transcript_109728/g.317277 Transcript_109728/m.317277 type:complete len:389 (+) Transcript_109728:43-1209(+)